MVRDYDDTRSLACRRSERHPPLIRAGEVVLWTIGAHIALTMSPLTLLATFFPLKFILLAYLPPSLLFGLHMSSPAAHPA